jgi:RNA recognition motif-containing protein
MGKNVSNLYIKGIKEGITEDEIKEVFTKFGEVTSICIQRKNLNISGQEVNSGFAFINFKNSDDCKDAYLKGKVDD